MLSMEDVDRCICCRGWKPDQAKQMSQIIGPPLGRGFLPLQPKALWLRCVTQWSVHQRFYWPFFFECCKQDPKALTIFLEPMVQWCVVLKDVFVSMEHIPKFRDIASHLWFCWQRLPVSSEKGIGWRGRARKRKAIQQKAACCWGEAPLVHQPLLK